MVMYDAAYYAAIRKRLLGQPPKSAAILPNEEPKIKIKVPDAPQKEASATVPIDYGLTVPPLPPRIRFILQTLCRAYEIPHGLIAGPSRLHRLMLPRMEAAIAMRDLGVSLSAIGKYLKRDHSTIIHYLTHTKAPHARQQWLCRCETEEQRSAGRLSNAALGYTSAVEASGGQAASDASQEADAYPLGLGTGLQPGIYVEAAE